MPALLPAASTTAADPRFALGHCALGTFVVAWSERGISAIELADDSDRLIADFLSRSPDAVPVLSGSEVTRLLRVVSRFIDEPARGLDLPLDIQGTAFEQRVWAALREIPAGRTASYSDLARRIGAPTSVRAVARACASNRIAVAIPCHRVVGRHGALTGYRWGIERKAALLERERR